jgi:hypothetical protein
MRAHIINLSNGVELLDAMEADRGPGEPVQFIRIQSTWCEQGRWSDVITGVSDSLLLHMALGHECIVYDGGSRTECPRALWQGLTWIQWAAARSWGAVIVQPPPNSRAQASLCSFDAAWRALPNGALSRLKWYRRFLPAEPVVNVRSVWRWAEHDGKGGVCADAVRRYFAY